ISPSLGRSKTEDTHWLSAYAGSNASNLGELGGLPVTHRDYWVAARKSCRPHFFYLFCAAQG
ncbi:MAG: hypothetical protein AABX24_03220, partial [Nanoarchaeota archaeon]